ncbi:MAG: DMT family transporter [Planctomycetes bacterium]|nr:DMT family transporter [Planctomycetota bacterium]
MTPTRSPKLGALLTIAAVIVFGLQDGVSKLLTERYSVFFVITVRYWAFAALLVLLHRGRLPAVAATHHPWRQLLRGVLLAGQVCMIVQSFAALGLTTTHAVFSCFTLLVALGSWLFLGERVSRARQVAIAVGFAGVLVILRPGAQVFDPMALLPLAGAVTFASYQLLTRTVAGRDHPRTSFLYTGLGGALVMTCIGPFWWERPDLEGWLWLAVVSASSMFGHYLLIQALRHAEASAIQPLIYVQLVVATTVGVVAFDEVLDAVTVLGAAMVVGAGLYTLGAGRRARRAAAAAQR